MITESEVEELVKETIVRFNEIIIEENEEFILFHIPKINKEFSDKEIEEIKKILNKKYAH